MPEWSNGLDLESSVLVASWVRIPPPTTFRKNYVWLLSSIFFDECISLTNSKVLSDRIVEVNIVSIRNLTFSACVISGSLSFICAPSFPISFIPKRTSFNFVTICPLSWRSFIISYKFLLSLILASP